MNNDQLVVAYVNIAAGTSTDIHQWLYLHKLFKAQGFLSLIDIRIVTGRGMRLIDTFVKVKSLSSEEGEKKMRYFVHSISFDDYLLCLQHLTGPGGLFYNLIQL